MQTFEPAAGSGGHDVIQDRRVEVSGDTSRECLTRCHGKTQRLCVLAQFAPMPSTHAASYARVGRGEGGRTSKVGTKDGGEDCEVFLRV